METVKDFFKHINYRISSPLIFSFTISWLICNWKVPAALLFYNNELTHIEGLTQYLDFVHAHFNLLNSLIYPLTGALLYTFVFPHVNKCIREYQTKIEVKAEKAELDIRQGSSIPIEKYLDMRSALMERQKQLEEIITAESSTQVQLQESINEYNRVIIDKDRVTELWNNAKGELAKYEILKKEFETPENLETFFTKDWVCEFYVAQRKEKRRKLTLEPFEIEGDNYVSEGKVLFKIHHIRYVDFLKTMIFHKVHTKAPAPGDHIVTITRVNDQLWVGSEKLPGELMSYVRYYPAANPPDFYPLHLHKTDLHNDDALIESRRNIDNWLLSRQKLIIHE